MSSVANISLRSISRNLTRQCHALPIRTFSTNALPGDNHDDNESRNTNSSIVDFGSKIFAGLGDSSSKDPFYRKLDRLEKAQARREPGSMFNQGNREHSSNFNLGMDDFLSQSFDSLSDGMDGKLKKAGTYFEFDPQELEKDDYSFRPDMRFNQGGTYTVKDLDLRKPGVTKSFKPREFDVTTEEALKKADFRNVRFLANFITEAGIIHKRSKMGIRAKAQRKVAREIKTARAFGLMPFTTMGTKSFTFGISMGNNENDFTYQTFGDDNADDDPTFDDLAAKD